jgi:hypothetical protein
MALLWQQRSKHISILVRTFRRKHQAVQLDHIGLVGIHHRVARVNDGSTSEHVCTVSTYAVRADNAVSPTMHTVNSDHVQVATSAGDIAATLRIR